MVRSRPFALALAFSAGSVLPLFAQSVRSLSKPDAEFPDPFSTVSGIRELSDGRVVAIDTKEKVVEILDFRTGKATKVGREGSGPGEYALPLRLLAFPGDTSAVFDMLNQRMLLVLPNGKPGDFFSMDQGGPPGGPGGGFRVTSQPPQVSDASGRLYSLGSGFRFVQGQPPQPPDSQPILRYDRRTKKTDTLAWVRVPKNNSQVSGGAGNVRMTIGAANPFAARDDWAVTPDGRVAVVRAPEYRVDWFGAGAPRIGTPIPYEKIKVSEGHKQQWRDSRKGQTAMMITNNNGQRSVQTPPVSSFPEPTDWPDVMPPFLASSTFVAPDGNLWVLRTRQGNDYVPSLDVIDTTGKVIGRVMLPAKTRLAGFGKGVAYVVRTDEDDLQYLQRFKLQ